MRPQAPSSRSRFLELAFVALVLLTMVFFVPGADIAISRLFYTPGAGFVLGRADIFEMVRAAAPTVILCSLVLIILIWLGGLFGGDWLWNISTRPAVYLLATVAIGPGLIVETVLKPHWGRARPKDLVDFGGHAVYTPPFVMAHECEHNCSFVSGHAAIAFWLTAYVFLLPATWRLKAAVIASMTGVLIGLVRIIQGAHFISDVTAAGCIIIGVNIIFARLILVSR